MCVEKSTIDDFKRKIFKFSNKKPGIYELDVGFDDSKENWVAAFGDIDQTSYTDVIMTSKDAKTLELYKWGDKEASKCPNIAISPIFLDFEIFIELIFQDFNSIFSQIYTEAKHCCSWRQ
jgi:hypothetical protein